MHRNLLSWYEDDYVIAKDMVDNAAELENDQGRSGLLHLFSQGHQLHGTQRVRESPLVSEYPRRSPSSTTSLRHVAKLRGSIGPR